MIDGCGGFSIHPTNNYIIFQLSNIQNCSGRSPMIKKEG